VRRLLLVALAALLAAGPASGKELTGFTLCGPDGCKTTTISGFGHEGPAGPPGDAAPPGPYYRVTLLVDGTGTWQMFYIRDTGQLAYVDGIDTRIVNWAQPAPKLARLLKDAARHVTPYPGPRITAVTVGGRRVKGNPASYLKLFQVDGDYADPGLGRAEPIRFASKVPSPWTERPLSYYPGTDVVAGAGRSVRVSRALAADIEAGRPLDAGGSGGLAGWAVALAAIVAMAATVMVVAVLGVLIRRRAVRAASSGAVEAA
jgi:hypothetical protein